MKLPLVSSESKRREALREQLLATADLLSRRRAGEISEKVIDEYVALNWLEWHGGSLRLTTTGENMCKHMTAMIGQKEQNAAP